MFQLTALELEYEIQSKITSAALKLANDTSAGKVFVVIGK